VTAGAKVGPLLLHADTVPSMWGPPGPHGLKAHHGVDHRSGRLCLRWHWRGGWPAGSVQRTSRKEMMQRRTRKSIARSAAVAWAAWSVYLVVTGVGVVQSGSDPATTAALLFFFAVISFTFAVWFWFGARVRR
jgi:hypothetical protein